MKKKKKSLLHDTLQVILKSSDVCKLFSLLPFLCFNKIQQLPTVTVEMTVLMLLPHATIKSKCTESMAC